MKTEKINDPRIPPVFSQDVHGMFPVCSRKETTIFGNKNVGGSWGPRGFSGAPWGSLGLAQNKFML